MIVDINWIKSNNILFDEVNAAWIGHCVGIFGSRKSNKEINVDTYLKINKFNIAVMTVMVIFTGHLHAWVLVQLYDGTFTKLAWLQFLR
jgi:uncharacterized membrane protein